MAIPVYPSDLSDVERTLLGLVLPPAKSSGRPRSVDLRRILNDLCNLVCSGCAWRSVHLLICSSACPYHRLLHQPAPGALHAAQDAVDVGDDGGVGDHREIEVSGIGEGAETHRHVAAQEAAQQREDVNNARAKKVERGGGAGHVGGD